MKSTHLHIILAELDRGVLAVGGRYNCKDAKLLTMFIKILVKFFLKVLFVKRREKRLVIEQKGSVCVCVPKKE